ncbi:hypothetical protein HNR44_000953 [Geomicrobium halophilum]|uniref:Uncharacterized protein n=1 Tax=Geomicrobium halophilum TaxID=549000 RepID=A0A841PMQ0_9BACL|nr:hypothetical protein [Geomicrobium halophilum]MBB6449004.1 hypothetical protein [Geomicrobium halophilum]
MVDIQKEKEDMNRNENNTEEAAATSLPSRLDKHGTRKKQKSLQPKRAEQKKESFHVEAKDYNKSPMIANVLLILFIMLVMIIFSFALSP